VSARLEPGRPAERARCPLGRRLGLPGSMPGKPRGWPARLDAGRASVSEVSDRWEKGVEFMGLRGDERVTPTPGCAGGRAGGDEGRSVAARENAGRGTGSRGDCLGVTGCGALREGVEARDPVPWASGESPHAEDGREQGWLGHCGFSLNEEVDVVSHCITS